MAPNSQTFGFDGQLARYAWVGIAVLLLASALYAGSREFGASLSRGEDVAGRFETALSGTMPEPLSYKGRRQLLLDCVEMTNSLYGRIQPEQAFQRVAARCKTAAARELQSNPHSGFAALVLASIAAAEADWPQFNDMLRLSQSGAAAEQWISIARLRLYVRHADRLAPETLPARAADIRLLLESPAGIKSIVALYRDTAGLRGLIAEQAENLSEEKQALFVRTLEEALDD